MVKQIECCDYCGKIFEDKYNVPGLIELTPNVFTTTTLFNFIVQDGRQKDGTAKSRVYFKSPNQLLFCNKDHLIKYFECICDPMIIGPAQRSKTNE